MEHTKNFKRENSVLIHPHKKRGLYNWGETSKQQGAVVTSPEMRYDVDALDLVR